MKHFEKAKIKNAPPPHRCLRGYAFDPSMSLNIDTAGINEITYKIPWEADLRIGPEGEYLHVIDRDPASDAFYKPVDLNDNEILAQNGLDPSESNPQFHQQMVYAVAMNTIANFEKAIGRKVQWSRRTILAGPEGKEWEAKVYVPKLLIYPHALRTANAYYSSDKKALLFGYFTSTPLSEDMHMPGSTVYSCLSHDIIAHETTHAILDGIFESYMEPTNPDVSAFHEAFADIVALFQHFSFSEVLQDQIAKTKGNFNAENLLSKLAVEFGSASGSYGSLRDAIGEFKGNEWARKKPDLNEYKKIFEPHDRGSLLVAAVFDSFITIYTRRSSDFIRIATNGSGILPAGMLAPDLVKRLANEASKTATHVLNMCIRALDYCPAIDINFGDYLRAIITADVELVQDDSKNYRLAFVDSFKKRGIYPDGIPSLSIEALTYTADELPAEFRKFSDILNQFLKDFKNELAYQTDRAKIFRLTKEFIRSRKMTARERRETTQKKGTLSYRVLRAEKQEIKVIGLLEYLYREAVHKKENNAMFERLTGLVFSHHFKQMNIPENRSFNGPAIDIFDIRLNNRVSPDGNIQNEAIIILTQQCGVNVHYHDQEDRYDISTFPVAEYDDFKEGSFIFRGSATLIFDLNTLTLKHVISKPIFEKTLNKNGKEVYIPNNKRVQMQYRCMFGDYADLTGFAEARRSIEPIAHIHNNKTAAHD